MSARALLKGAESVLRAFLADPDGRVCGVRPAGKPPPVAGQLYYAVHWAGTSERNEPTVVNYTDAEHLVTVTVTARVGEVPDDRRGRVYDAGGLVDLAEAVAAPGVVHGNYALLAAANALIPGTAEYDAASGGGVATNGFVEPLWLLAVGPVLEKPSSWVGSADGGGDVYAVEVRFGRARRIILG